MEDNVTRCGHKRHEERLITNYHYYRVVDLTIQEMNNCFSEVSTELLSCITCLDPRNSFSQFNVDQLMRLAALYHEDFSTNDCLYLP
ncbi:hypothetical protein C2S52_020356 [Perilla frutescens var. hirtella]|nr:hypothetical protein C2S52_020356 [Perilla frutescens var. hirtella]KAH6805568.1 hypothetical protein C2S51_030399 [Perilla frutescens var. frutescens]